MKKRLNLIILIGILLFIILLFSKFVDFKNLQDDLLFIKFISDVKNKENDNKLAETKNIKTENMQYIFNIEYKNAQFNNINLLDTINTKTLVNEKIAPGIEGKFDIVIYSNHKANYNVYFQSLTKKPQNLKFFVFGTNIYVESLEELSESLKGTIQKGDKKIITIGWEWTYENGQNGNLQDTEDAKLIDKYLFNILAIGEEML